MYKVFGKSTSSKAGQSRYDDVLNNSDQKEGDFIVDSFTLQTSSLNQRDEEELNLPDLAFKKKASKKKKQVPVVQRKPINLHGKIRNYSQNKQQSDVFESKVCFLSKELKLESNWEKVMTRKQMVRIV